MEIKIAKIKNDQSEKYPLKIPISANITKQFNDDFEEENETNT